MKKSHHFFPRVSHGIALAALFTIPFAVFADEPTFQALTSIPGISVAAGTPDIPSFLNNLYKICIGAAGVLAVLQIIRGGITYMLGDSITEKREARHHISLAVFGLVLVLSPAIVFGIIDPKILSLDVNVGALSENASNTNQNTEACSPVRGADGVWHCDPVTGEPNDLERAAAACVAAGNNPTIRPDGTLACVESNAEDFPQGRTPVTTEQEDACAAQTPRCSLERSATGSSCVCSGTFDFPADTFTTVIQTSGSSAHPGCSYAETISYPDRATCQAALSGIQGHVLDSPADDTVVYECVASTPAPAKDAHMCADVGTYTP